MDNVHIEYGHSSKYRVPVVVLIISGECAHSTYSEWFLFFGWYSNMCNIWFASRLAAFLESSKMPVADCIRGETVIVVRGDDLLSRLHA